MAGPQTVGATDNVCRTLLSAELVTGDERIRLPIASDSTCGLLTTGSVLLDVDAVATAASEFTIELRAAGGFPRPPRIFRMDLNVIPITQSRAITNEVHLATGEPDWSFVLKTPGLQFAAGAEPIALSVLDATGQYAWRRCERLSDMGPADAVFEFDPVANRVTFGNGVNGRIPQPASQVLASYAVSDAEAGAVARNRKWQVVGLEGVYGINLDPIVGGARSQGLDDLRRDARWRSRADHALVTADDIAAAALGLPLLEVARAWVTAPSVAMPQTGAITLVAMRSRPSGREQGQVPETKRWLNAIRNALLARIPLGTKLVVAAPRYSPFSIQATLEAQPRFSPDAVQARVDSVLRTRLALDGATARKPGVSFAERDVNAWMRMIEGVKRVVDLKLLDANGKDATEIRVQTGGLPRWDYTQSRLDVVRPGAGGAA